MKLCALLAIILYYYFNFWVKMDNFFNTPHHSSAVGRLLLQYLNHSREIMNCVSY